MSLRDPPPNLVEHRRRRPAARAAAHERNDAEVAREAAAVLHLHEGANAVETHIGLDAANRPHIAGDETGCLLARKSDNRDVGGHPRERVTGEIGTASRHEHVRMRSRGARDGLPRLAHGLVCHAAGIDDRDLRVLHLAVAVGEQPLADGLGIRLRDLAAEEPDREARHGAGCYCGACRSAAHPSSLRRPIA